MCAHCTKRFICTVHALVPFMNAVADIVSLPLCEFAKLHEKMWKIYIKIDVRLRHTLGVHITIHLLIGFSLFVRSSFFFSSSLSSRS